MKRDAIERLERACISGMDDEYKDDVEHLLACVQITGTTQINLLTALETLVAVFSESGMYDDEVFDDARSAIAQARGEM